MVDGSVIEEKKSRWTELYLKEDWWSIWFGAALILVVAVGWITKVPKVGKWTDNPLTAFPADLILPLVLLVIGLGVLTAIGVAFMKLDVKRYLAGFLVVMVLSTLSYFLANQATMKAWGIGYAIWALGIGLVIANTVGTPEWILKGARSEMFIKTGLVLLGAEILFNRILKLGGPGLMVAWIVTPTVIIFMWLFGTRYLKMTNKPLVIIIAAATSVCGVSAAIATSAACRSKKDDLTLAVGMTMIFTVLMMVLMPPFAKFIGLSPAVAGAWLGGTIDSTGAVVAAGAFLGEKAEQVAAVVKMIQNVLIGLVAFAVAVFWVTRVDREADPDHKPTLMEVWYRFPKFILGFVAASVVFSFMLMPLLGETRVDSILNQTKAFRGWLFCMAFVAIGLESNFKELASQLVGGKPIILYILGQSFNILLTLLMAWIAFGGVLFEAF